MLSPSNFFLFYKKVFVTNFVTRITKFVTCIRKFVTAVTKFVTNFFLADSEKYQGERKKWLGERNNFQGDSLKGEALHTKSKLNQPPRKGVNVFSLKQNVSH